MPPGAAPTALLPNPSSGEGSGWPGRHRKPSTEGQRFGHRPYRRRGPGIPLGDHSRRGFDREHVAVRGLVVASSCTDVYDAFRITQGRIDQPLTSRVRPSDPRIADGRHQMSRGTSLHVPYGSHLQISAGRIENSAIEFLTCGAIYGSWLRLPISTKYHDWRPVSIFEVPGWSPSGAFVGLEGV